MVMERVVSVNKLAIDTRCTRKASNNQQYQGAHLMSYIIFIIAVQLWKN